MPHRKKSGNARCTVRTFQPQTSCSATRIHLAVATHTLRRGASDRKQPPCQNHNGGVLLKFKFRPLPAYPPWTYYPVSPDSPTVTDITETPLGREVHSLLAWDYNTDGGQTLWPTGKHDTSSNTFYLMGYDRPARIVAFGAYGAKVSSHVLSPQEGELGHAWCAGVLEGSPLKSSCLIPDMRIMVQDESRSTPSTITGWHVIFARHTHTGNFFYDPSRRLLWKFGPDGTRYPHTKTWRVPHITEVALPKPLPEGVVPAPRHASFSLPNAWWIPRVPRMTARWQQRLDAALDTRCLILPETANLPPSLIPTWRRLCDQRGWGYSVLHQNRKVSSWRFQPDALDLDRYAVSDDGQEQLYAYWTNQVVPTISKRYSIDGGFGPYFIDMVLPTDHAMEHIPALLRIMDTYRTASHERS